MGLAGIIGYMADYFVKDLYHYCNVQLETVTAIGRQKIDYYDFTFVLDGRMTYYYGEERCDMERNDAIFFPPGTIRKRMKAYHKVKFVSFNFTAQDGVRFSFPPFMKKCINQVVRQLVNVYPQHHLLVPHFTREMCKNLLNLILFELQKDIVEASSNVHVRKMLTYINEHITERLSLTEIAQTTYLSKEYACMLFKKEMGKTIFQYINEQKMMIARDMIINRQMSMNEIAGYLGFDDYNYFCRVFKAAYQTSPGKYRAAPWDTI